jgi:hypothetical protein
VEKSSPSQFFSRRNCDGLSWSLAIEDELAMRLFGLENAPFSLQRGGRGCFCSQLTQGKRVSLKFVAVKRG